LPGRFRLAAQAAFEVLDETHRVVQTGGGVPNGLGALLVLDGARQVHLGRPGEVLSGDLDLERTLIGTRSAEPAAGTIQEPVAVAHPFLGVVETAGHRGLLLERLIHAEMSDLQPQRVHPNEGVWDRFSEQKIDLNDVSFTSPLLPRAKREILHVEIDRGLVRRRLEFAERDVFDLDVDLVDARACQEGLDNPRPVIRRDRGFGEGRREEEKGVRIVALNRRSRLKCVVTKRVRK
jgi:hypothetical protein